MSAFASTRQRTRHGRDGRRGASLRWSLAALALAIAGTALAQAANSIEQRDGVQGQLGPHDRPVHAEGAAGQSARRASRSPARRASRSISSTPATAWAPTQRASATPALRSLNVVQAGNRTRVVFNLNKPQTFETQVEGNTVLVTLIDQATRVAAEHADGAALRRGAAGRRARTRCATSISAAARTAKAASSSTCPTTRPASTSASRARR